MINNNSFLCFAATFLILFIFGIIFSTISNSPSVTHNHEAAILILGLADQSNDIAQRKALLDAANYVDESSK